MGGAACAERDGFREGLNPSYRPGTLPWPGFNGVSCLTVLRRDVPAFHGEDDVIHRGSICVIALVAALCLPVRAQEFPDLSGQWKRPPGVGIQWDQTKPIGR